MKFCLSVCCVDRRKFVLHKVSDNNLDCPNPNPLYIFITKRLPRSRNLHRYVLPLVQSFTKCPVLKTHISKCEYSKRESSLIIFVG